MAIFYFRAKCGKNLSHLEYINRENKYSSKNDLIISKTFNLPENFKDINDFYETALKNERFNSNLYREFEIALVKEFSDKKNEEILDKFLDSVFSDRFVYNYAFHNPNDQPHAHVMFCERELDKIEREKNQFFKRYNSKNPDQGGAKKNREFQKKQFLFNVRKKWENHLNLYLEVANIEKISSDSLKKQREEAIKENDFVKAELLNRDSINYKEKYKKNEKEKTKAKKIKELNDYIKIENYKLKLNEEYIKLKKENKYNSIEDILEKIENIESNISNIAKKLNEKNIENDCLNILTNNKIFNLSNEKRKLFKQLKDEKFEENRNIIKEKINSLQEEIINLKNSIDKKELNNLKLDREKNLNTTLKKLTENLKIYNKILEDKFEKNINNYKYKELYEMYKTKKTVIKNIKEEKENENFSLKNLLSEIKELKEEINKMYKKIDNKNIENDCLNILTNNKIFNLSNDKRKLFKQLKNEKDKEKRDVIKEKINRLQEEIIDLKNNVDKEKLEKLKLDRKENLKNRINNLLEKLKNTEAKFEKNINIFENKKLYDEYISIKNNNQNNKNENKKFNKNYFKNNKENIKIRKNNFIKTNDIDLKKYEKTFNNSIKTNEDLTKYGEFFLKDLDKFDLDDKIDRMFELEK